MRKEIKVTMHDVRRCDYIEASGEIAKAMLNMRRGILTRVEIDSDYAIAKDFVDDLKKDLKETIRLHPESFSNVKVSCLGWNVIEGKTFYIYIDDEHQCSVYVHTTTVTF